MLDSLNYRGRAS